MNQTTYIKNVDFEKICINIQRKYVNIFLSSLWDDFELSIGRVSCQHNYLDTSDPELYIYNIVWSDRDLPFTAELSFYNHTSKGIEYVLLATINSETKKTDEEYKERIKQCIYRCITRLNEKKLSTTYYMKVTVNLNRELSGNYIFESADIILLSKSSNNTNECYLVFPIHVSNDADIQSEWINKCATILSVLTTATQNLFSINENESCEYFSSSTYESLLSNTEFNGKFLSDEGLIQNKEILTEDGTIKLVCDQELSQEIIEEQDCVKDNLLFMPERIELVFKVVEDDYRLQQSCRRFHEAIMLRKLVARTPSAIFYLAYELIAYVSSIEANLDTKLEKIEVICPTCDSIVYKDEWKISEKFRKFVLDYSDSSYLLSDVFKSLYNDRSMFVHTGINLHKLGSIRTNRPMILKGKRCLTDFPSYYYNIHEYTGFILRKYIYSKLFCKLPAEHS